MVDLKAAADEQQRTHYLRHGVKPPMFGVPAAVLRGVAKQVKRNQPIAEALWASGNHDARILATMIADPALCAPETLERWCRTTENALLAETLGAFAATFENPLPRIDQWCRDRGEFVRATGYYAAIALVRAGGGVPAEWVQKRIGAVAKDMNGAANRAREAMARALVAFGSGRDGTFAAAMTVAKRLGIVDIDHGEAGVKELDLVAELTKARAKRK
ncbi:MAG TPA: DNA alkylation repair protein [Phycisphaerales bacterium]|nr:DNA alkylation repair protein [Phycisphaerales bacterium]HMP38548.1 DNA alkylation repair protein [Phycisphaerales bacterium]